MARVIGSEAGGYATILPTENYIGQALQNVEQNAFKYREEKRLEEAKKAALAKAQQDALDKQREEEANDLEKIGAIRAKDSGISGIDSAVSNGLASAREEYINYKRAYRKSGDKNDLVKMSTALNKLHAISTIPDSYKKVVDNIRDMYNKEEIDDDELDRLTELGDKIEKGFVVPKIENGVMSFDVFERDDKGQISKQAIKNMKGEDLINQLTPQKKFDKLKDIEEVSKGYGPAVTNFNRRTNENVTEVPDLENKIKNSVNLLLQDEARLKKYAKAYGINKAAKDLTQEEKTAIANQYTTDLRNNFNRGAVPNMVLRDQKLQEENDRLKKAEGSKKTKEETPFEPPVDVVIKGGANSDLGVKIAKGDKILGPTYKQGKSGPVNGVVLRPDGTYVFSVSERKDKSLNAQGLANQKAWEQDEANAGEEFEPDESDYKFSPSKPTAFTSTKNSNVLSKYVRGMLNPATGKNFQNFTEYQKYYNKFKPTASATNQVKETKKAPAAKKAAFDAVAFYNQHKGKK